MSELFQQEIKNRRTPPSTTEILFNPNSPAFIHPNDHVLVVSPGIQKFLIGEIKGLPMDRSLMVLPHYLDQKNGRVTVLDVPDDAGFGFGDHSLELTQEWFKYVSSKLPTCPIQYLSGYLLESSLNFPSKYDRVIDHLTTFDWLTSGEPHLDSFSKMAHYVVSLYSSILNPGGSIIMHFRNDLPNRIYTVAKSMTDLNLKANTIEPINDRYAISKPLEREIRKIKHRRSPLVQDHHLLSYYNSTRVLVGQKIF